VITLIFIVFGFNIGCIGVSQSAITVATQNDDIPSYIQESQALTRMRGGLDVSKVEMVFSQLSVRKAGCKLSGATITISNIVDWFVVNSTSSGYINISSSVIELIIMNSSSSIADYGVDFYSNDKNNDYQIECVEMPINCTIRGGSLHGNKDRYILGSLSNIKGYLSLESQIWVFFSNGSSPLHIVSHLDNLNIELPKSISINFEGSLMIDFTESTYIGSMRSFDYISNSDYDPSFLSQPSIITLTDCLGNFSVGPDFYSVNGFDELVLINSFTYVHDENDLGVNISYNDLNSERRFHIAFGYINREAHITQLIINGEIMYSARLIILEAPSEEIFFDESLQTEINLRFTVYNPTRYDIINLEILFTKELGRIFTANFTIKNQFNVEINTSGISYKLDYLPAKSELECAFRSESEFFVRKEQRTGEIKFLSQNSEDVTYLLEINYTNVVIEFMKLLTAIIPLAIPILPITNDFRNSCKNI